MVNISEINYVEGFHDGELSERNRLRKEFSKLKRENQKIEKIYKGLGNPTILEEFVSENPEIKTTLVKIAIIYIFPYPEIIDRLMVRYQFINEAITTACVSHFIDEYQSG
jgi:hypothetical protein